LTDRVQEAFAAKLAPDRDTEADLAVTVPPHVLLRPFGVETARPEGRLSVKLSPVTDDVLDAGLVIENVRLVDPPTVILGAPNDFVIDGGAVVTEGPRKIYTVPSR
jgi:hypothetical protein